MAVVGLERSTTHLLPRKSPSTAAPGGSLLESCGAWILHRRILDGAGASGGPLPLPRYENDMAAAVGAAMGGSDCAAFLMRPLAMSKFAEVVGSGKRLPAKTTRFHPKPPTGLVMRKIGETL